MPECTSRLSRMRPPRWRHDPRDPVAPPHPAADALRLTADASIIPTEKPPRFVVHAASAGLRGSPPLDPAAPPPATRQEAARRRARARLPFERRAQGPVRPPRARRVAAGLALLLLAAAPAAAQVGPVRAETLRHMVLNDCGSCHGLTMKGGLGSDLRPGALAATPPEAIAAIILDGVPGTAMPPWRPLLSEADADWIAHFLKSGAK